MRHRQFAQMRETFLKDDDFMKFYNAGMADVAGAPDHVAMRYLHVGDIRPPSWWWTFGNLRPRDAARGFDPHVLERLASSPALRFTGPIEGVGDSNGRGLGGLRRVRKSKRIGTPDPVGGDRG
ncbi:hypothetical protein [Kutzneria sp. NPDC051319]|uniref:hypothetical protein n=1 Tax=Kutzneria sp. NPDC051319 TaxID=3155047 RepID=UPI00342B0541